MRRALELAGEAARAGEVPIGAVLVCGERRFEAQNEKERRPDPTAHAELLAIRAAAAALGVWRLPQATLYVTQRTVCDVRRRDRCGAHRAARVRLPRSERRRGGQRHRRFRFASGEPPRRRVAGVLEDETSEQLRAFFAERRAAAKSSEALL